MGPQNGIVGDNTIEPTAPQSSVVDEGLNELKKTVKFAKSKEFQELKKHLESRIDFYQKYLPNGENVIAKTDPAELGYMWLAANVITGELQAIINGYEQSIQLYKEESARQQ